jgi:hypothetical protein
VSLIYLLFINVILIDMRTKERVLSPELAVVAESMNVVISTGLRNDKFILSDNNLGQDCISLAPKFPSRSKPLYPYFPLMGQNGKLMVIPSRLVLDGRMLTSAIPDSKLEKLEKTRHCFIGDSYNAIMDRSELFHDYYGVKEDQPFFMPPVVKLFGAMVSCDREGNPKPSLWSYELYREYYIHCADNGQKHSLDLFKSELQKTGKERLPFLPSSLKQPRLHDYLQDNLRPSDYMFTLLFVDIED